MKLKAPFLFFVLGLLLLSSCRSREDWGRIFVKEGDRYMARGQYEEAIQEFEKARRINPSNDLIYIHQGKAYYQAHNWGPALECFNTAIFRLPEIPVEIYLLRGAAILELNHDLEEALRLAYDPAVKREPTNGRCFYERGRAYQKFGRLDLADKDFKMAEELGYAGNQE